MILVDSYSKFHEFVEPKELHLPASTVEFEQEGKVNAYFLLLTLLFFSLPPSLLSLSLSLSLPRIILVII